jgi:hypothetical protein
MLRQLGSGLGGVVFGHVARLPWSLHAASVQKSTTYLEEIFHFVGCFGCPAESHMRKEADPIITIKSLCSRGRRVTRF